MTQELVHCSRIFSDLAQGKNAGKWRWAAPHHRLPLRTVLLNFVSKGPSPLMPFQYERILRHNPRR